MKTNFERKDPAAAPPPPPPPRRPAVRPGSQLTLEFTGIVAPRLAGKT